jgi:tryptophan halogenase
VGGGTAGWMTAAALSEILRGMNLAITLIESDQIGTVGVGEATIPQIGTFNRTLGIDENDFVRRTKGSFKLGIEFVNWGRKGERYIHPFGGYGLDMNGVSFHAYFLKHHAQQYDTQTLEQYSLQARAARAAKFMRPVNAGNSPLSSIAYAFHFDAGLYAEYLRAYSEARGVRREEGRVVSVTRHAENGFIESVTLDDGRRFEADLFIDCSGFRGLLIEEALRAGYNDWRHWLPCDRAVAVPCERVDPLLSYTRATAHEFGWQWRIPLQHRTGNGLVYSSQHASEETATERLLASLDGAPLASPRHLRFTTGHRRKFWDKNVVAIGLAAGFLEPLESTSIHLIQTAIARLLQHFPSGGFEAADIDRYNRVTTYEYERVRDFLILHYHATQRDDSDFWNYTRNMSIPDYLSEKMRLFRANGRVFRENDELFNDTSWFAVFIGQNIRPRDYDPVADAMSPTETATRLSNIRQTIETSLSHMPLHADFIAERCAAEPYAVAAE